MGIKELLLMNGEPGLTMTSAPFRDSVQAWLNIKTISGGVVVTGDNRYVKILEILPVNIYLKSEPERRAIIEAFASYLKIAPDHMQFQARTMMADLAPYMERMKDCARREENAACRAMIEDNMREISRDIAADAICHRFFMVFSYESHMGAKGRTPHHIIECLNDEADVARRYLTECELEVVEPRYADNFILDLLYDVINKHSSRRNPLPEGVFDMVTTVHGIYEEVQ